MELTTGALTLSSSPADAALATALTFDDVLLVPQHSTVVPAQVDVSTAPHPPHPAERPDSQRGHGHRDRVGPGHRDGADRRAGRHPQEPVDRRAGGGSGPRQALRKRDDREPDHALPRQHAGRGAGPDAAVPHLGRADHRGRQQGRPAGGHPDQPRPAVREQPQAPDRRRDDAEPALHRAGGHDARRGAQHPAPAQGRKAAGGRPGLPAEGADHGQGHPEGHQVPERVQGLAGPPALRRGHRRGARRDGTRRRRWSRPAWTCW